MKTTFIALFLFLFSNAYSQSDTASHDKIYMNDGSQMTGKVVTVKTDLIVFLDNETDLTYEIQKARIRLIILSNGKSLTFKEESTEKKEKSSVDQSKTDDKEGGTSTGVIILASIGGVLGLLLLIGAIASSGGN
jgi:hypothetical protein